VSLPIPFMCVKYATLKKKTTQPLSTCCGEECRIALTEHIHTYPIVHLGPRMFARMQACHMTITFTSNRKRTSIHLTEGMLVTSGHPRIYIYRVPMCIDIHRLFPQHNGFLLTG
jgi:hypothetical protein